MSNLIFNQNNPLAHIDQSQILKQKIMSIHTTDRDKTKWPYGNEFEIQLPEKMTNVQSMRLVTISLPTNQYVFSNEYQNTKLSFSVTFDSSNNTTNINGKTHDYIITIDEGSYSAEQLVTELDNKMNNEVNNDASWNTTTFGTYNYFNHYFCFRSYSNR